jgi:diguanylate cyclase (GGDEF)-like protein
VRGLILACLLICAALSAGTAVAEATLAEVPTVLKLAPGGVPPAPDQVVSGALDLKFAALQGGFAGFARDSWLKFDTRARLDASGIPVLVVQASRQLHADIFVARGGVPAAVPVIAKLPGFLGLRESVFAIPEDVAPGQSLYAHITMRGAQAPSLSFTSSTLDAVLSQAAARARMIAFAFGALTAVSLAALLIWFVLKDRVFLLYTAMFFLQALYIVYLSGQGFDWPYFSVAVPWASFAWNVPVALSGSAACLFTREIADLKRYAPRSYQVFGWLSIIFVLLAFANTAKLFGFGPLVNALGNVLFLGLTVYTALVCFMSWRRGNRPAGWFLLAWALLEGFTIGAAVAFLLTSQAPELLLFTGLPLSMVAASILIALGVADRLRAQRVALSEAERRAQTDPLTGVLNRNSLIERLHAACQRAQARALPISLLFIDLDHFKQINDSFGHQAGDACLRAIIAPIQTELRQSDVIGRYGGEEFVVILSGADAQASVPVAQRILERVANVQVDGFGLPIRLTCSIGIASSDTLGVWGDHLVARADAAVYAAKRAGRNQLFVAQPVAT